MKLQTNYVLQHITTEEVLPLRARILRPHQPIEKSFYAEDDLETTFHLGIYANDKIICNGTFIQGVCLHFPDESKAYRLRGMATDPAFRGQQLGSKLLLSAEELLRQKNCPLLWFNARESAFIFYEKNGFKMIGDLFDIPTLGPHKVMYKFL